MAKPKAKRDHDEKETTAIIELALNDIQTLADAFNLIDEICQNRETVSIDADAMPTELWVH